MTKIENRDEALSRCRVQYDQTKLYAQYWMAMATTGAACLRQTSQGRPVTEDEKAKGEVIGWEPHTDQQKIKSALDISMVHIQRLGPLGEVIIALELDDPKRYYDAIKESL
jgi:hypothetical protein